MMTTRSIRCLMAVAVMVSALHARASQTRNVAPTECVHRAEDFSLMWWAHGLRDRSPDGRRLRCVRTGRYGLALDVETADVVRLGPIRARQTYDQALVESNDVVLDLPPAKLDLCVDIAGTVYRCTGSSVKAKGHSVARLISAGRFVQRCDLLGLEFADERGNRLAAEGRLELIAWPDRLALRLDVQSEPTAGDPWSEATMAIRLTHDDGRVAQSASPVADLWHAGQKRTCHVVLKFPPRSPDAQSPEQTTVSAFDSVGNRPCKVEYDPLRGCHRVDLDRVVPQGAHNDAMERVRLTIRNPGDQEAVVRLALEKSRHGFRVRGIQPITGLSPMLRDRRGNPLGIPVQISKNWHTQRDPDVPYRGAWFHGYTLLHLPAESQTELEFTIVYAHWGGVPAASHAQLCLIGWGNNQLWHEAALGAWGESLCFEPDQGQVGGTVLDTRPMMVWGMKQAEPRKWGWTNNVGGADFLVYYDADGAKQWNSRMRTAYRRYGPNLTEVTFAGRSADGKIDLCATVSLYRTDDLVRGVYRFRYDVIEPAEFNRLVFFQAGGDNYSYTGERKFARGNESGLVDEWSTQWGGNTYRTAPVACTGRVPWFSMHEAVSRDKSASGAWANRGIILRHWDARLGGKTARPYAAERGAKVRGAETSLIDILPPPELRRLEAGDYVEAEVVHVVMPQHADDYYGPNENLRAALARGADTWKMIHREAVGNDLRVTARLGRVLRQYPVVVEVDEQSEADFTVTGGVGYIPITLVGFSRHAGYHLAEVRQGTAHPIDQSVHGNDFWQTDYDPATERFSRTYTIPLDTPGDQRQLRRFVVRRTP